MSAHTTRTTRGRPRDADVHQRILRTAFELAQSVGYVNVTMKAIAIHAKVGRQTVYRRWSTKEHLFMEVVLTQVEQAELSTQLNDLEMYLRRLFELARKRTGNILLALLMQASDDAVLAEDLQELMSRRRFLLEGIVAEDARRRGTSYVVPTEAVAELLAASMWYRLLYRYEQLDDAFAHELATIATKLTLKGVTHANK